MNLNFKQIGKGPAIVVLHGLFGMSDNWVSIAKKMSTDYCFYLLDLRNHGRSPHSAVFNIEVMTSDVKLFLENQGLSEVILLGHSMGGKVAMNFSVKYPQFLKNLIVVDIGLKRYDSPHFASFINAMLTVNLDVQSRKDIEKSLLSIPKIDSATAPFLLKNLVRNDEGTFQWRINLKALKMSIDSVLASVEIEGPVLVKSLFMKATRSDYILASDEQDIRQKFPNVQIVEIEHATHWVHSSSPLNFEKALRGFLV